MWWIWITWSFLSWVAFPFSHHYIHCTLIGCVNIKVCTFINSRRSADGKRCSAHFRLLFQLTVHPNHSARTRGNWMVWSQKDDAKNNEWNQLVPSKNDCVHRLFVLASLLLFAWTALDIAFYLFVLRSLQIFVFVLVRWLYFIAPVYCNASISSCGAAYAKRASCPIEGTNDQRLDEGKGRNHIASTLCALNGFKVIASKPW